MIKVGDTLILKRGLTRTYPRVKLPMIVNDISVCGTRGAGPECKECPGLINNNECFGRSEGYIVEPLKEWED